MYYEEAVIDYALCYRNRPDGEWIQFSLSSLTMIILGLRKELDAYKAKDEDLKLLKKASDARKGEQV